MKRFNRLLITCAAGRLGSELRRGPVPLAETIRLSDRIQYVVRGLETPSLAHTIAFGISNNCGVPVDDSKAERLGFKPNDSAEPYRENVESATPETHPQSPGAEYLGGWFCELPPPDDAEQA